MFDVRLLAKLDTKPDQQMQAAIERELVEILSTLVANADYRVLVGEGCWWIEVVVTGAKHLIKKGIDLLLDKSNKGNYRKTFGPQYESLPVPADGCSTLVTKGEGDQDREKGYEALEFWTEKAEALMKKHALTVLSVSIFDHSKDYGIISRFEKKSENELDIRIDAPLSRDNYDSKLDKR